MQRVLIHYQNANVDKWESRNLSFHKLGLFRILWNYIVPADIVGVKESKKAKQISASN